MKIRALYETNLSKDIQASEAVQRQPSRLALKQRLGEMS